MKRIFVMIFLSLTSVSLYAQHHQERRYVRSGNREYEREKYIESEGEYRRAFEKAPQSYAVGTNLANALYKQGHYEMADSLYRQFSAAAASPEEGAASAYNTGNAQFQRRELEKALESYKQSLRLHPDDQEAKFNLAYVKKMLKKDQDNQDNKDNQDNRDNKDNQDQQQKPQDQDQNQDNKQDQSQPEPSGMTPEEAEAMLEAMQREEEKTREKVDAQKVPAAVRSGKNW